MTLTQSLTPLMALIVHDIIYESIAKKHLATIFLEKYVYGYTFELTIMEISSAFLSDENGAGQTCGRKDKSLKI